jgi:hypothetical protein
MVVTNNANDIALSTDAVSTNTASTLVERDSSGNFAAGTITASLTGSASNNVLKAGDSMSGALLMTVGNAVRLQDTAGLKKIRDFFWYHPKNFVFRYKLCGFEWTSIRVL